MAKDDVLDHLADRWNVAQFASFTAGSDPQLRHVRVKDLDAAADARTVVVALLARSASGTVNVRAFTVEHSKGNPFHYGLNSADTVLAQVHELAAQGYRTIVNETIDVHDGGVSGVRLGSLVEFAPGGTPRVVEEPGVLSCAASLADRLLSTVYGVTTPQVQADERVEFSVHPNAVGLRGERVVVWELEGGQRVGGLAELALRPSWPNRVSRHLGDKTFGLLVADALGVAVPRTQVLARSVPPFSFGAPTGMDAAWVRTAPRSFAAGRFTTTRQWTDPFELLAKEDPDGTAIGAVLVQQAVRAGWSGAARFDQGSVVVEGVAGVGDVFMLGEQAPEALPDEVRRDVVALGGQLEQQLGSVRLEWAHDGEQLWLLQLNQLAVAQDVVVGSVDSWLDFDPATGLDELRALIDRAVAARAGVHVVRPVGLTSHVGDLLRQSGVPVRFERVMSMFDTAAEAYDRSRPPYPDEVIDHIISVTGLGAGQHVLEVGCGTGQATVALAARGLAITCVEMGPALAAIARRNASAFPDVTVVQARFEEWDPPHTFDAVAAATSWHWIDPDVKYRRARAALGPGGLLVIWNVHHLFPDGGDPFFREIQDVYEEIGEGMPQTEEWTRPGEMWSRREEIEGSGLFALVDERQFDWETVYDGPAYVELLETFSGHIEMKDWQRERLYGEVVRRAALRPDGLLRRHQGSMVSIARAI